MKKSLLIILFALMSVFSWAQGTTAGDGSTGPYAVLSENNTKLTFFYDDQKEARGGLSVGPFSGYNDQSWYDQRGIITTVVFDDSFANCTTLTSTYKWFYKCNKIEAIFGIGNLKTANVTSMGQMFDGCSALTSLDVSGFKTDKVMGMGLMFNGCYRLTSLDVSGFKTDKVTDMSAMFEGCSSLTSLDVSHFNTENVTSMSFMFNGCYRLTSLDVSGFKTDKVTGMSAMFEGCSSLTSLDVSHFNTENVTNIGGMFADCSGLTTLDLSNFKTDNVTEMNGMFSGCSGLTGLDVSGFNTANVPDMSVMFSGCSSLTSLDLSRFHTSNVTEMRGMFDGCSSLTNLDISGFNTANVEFMGSMFASCRSLTSLDVSGFNTAKVRDMQRMFDGCSSLTNLDISGFNTANVEFMGSMFASCRSLTSLDVSGFNTAKVTDMSGMFAGCSGLTSLDLSGFKTDKVTGMSAMFEDCSSLTSLDVSGFKTDNVTSMGSMFRGCSGLTSLDVSGFNTANVTDMNRLFGGCSGLTSLDVSGFNTANVTDMTGMFGGCSGLTSLDVSGFNTANVTDMTGMFCELGGAEISLDLSSFNTSNVTSMESMFDESRSLKGLNLSSFNTSNVTNMKFMFADCSGLTSIDLSSFNTSNVTNVKGMFRDCSALTTIYAGNEWSTEKVTDGSQMFSKSTSLVGGAGTVYDANHIDHTYAHIDGGENNPGYFTAKNAAPVVDIVAKPTFALEGDNLAISTTTDGASVYYSVKEFITEPSGNGSLSSPYNVAAALQYINTLGADTPSPDSVCIRGVVTEISEISTTYGNATFYITDDGRTTSDRFLAYRVLNVGNVKFTTENAFQVGDEVIIRGIVNNYKGLTPETLQNSAYIYAYTTPEMNMLYENPIALPDNVIVRAKATKQGMNDSEMAMFSAGSEPYAVLSENNTKLTFFYDNKKISNNGMGVGPFTVNYNTETKSYYVEGREWENHAGDIITVEFASSFANCRTITNMAGWFFGNTKLQTINGLEYLNTSNVTNMHAVFDDCSSLTSLDLSTFDTHKVTDMRGMFYGCTSLITLNVSSFNTSNVKLFNSMFNNCTALMSIDVSNFDTRNATSLRMMFCNCLSLAALDIKNFETSNVTDMYHVFSGLRLSGIDLSKMNTEKVETMEGLFYNTAFSSLNLSGFNTSQVKNMYMMFANSSNLQTIYVGDSWSTSNVTDGTNMFRDCTSLVGGSGTVYDANHADHTYAHIDGGENNPGYFTEKNASTSVAAPEFRFEGDYLTMTTATQNASIFYKVAELPSMAEAVVDSVVNSLVVTPDGQQSVYYQQPFELKMNAVVKAIAVADDASGTIVSDVTTMVYDYEAWMNLKAAVESGVDLYGRAKDNPNVDPQLLEDLRWALDEGDMIYNNRAEMDSFEATHFTQRINELCAQIEAQMTPTGTVATPNFSWQNDELTISTTTEGADIYYWLSDVDVNGDGVITDADYAHYNNPLTIQRDVTIKAYAAKQAMDNSEIRTLDYPYTSWQTLREVISYASSVADRARHSTKVPDQEVTSFEEDIAASYDMYERRTETKDRVEDVASYLSERAYEIERMMEVEATFVDGVLTIEGTTTVAEALESFGVSAVTESIAAIVYNSSVPMANSDLQPITNPNLLIYVKSDSLAPADRNNIIVNGFAKNIVLTDVTQGNNNFYCPQSFTAEAISYTREFRQKTQIGISRGWETIALPFKVQTIMHETRGLITPFGNNRSNTHFWLRRLTRDGLQSDSIMEANTAYLISMPNSEEYSAEYNLPGRVTFSAENAVVPVTEIVMDESANYMIAPVFQRLAAQNNLYVLNVGEERNGYPEGSIFESNYRAVLPFQAYTEHKGSNPAPPYFIIGDLGGDTTGIDATLVNSERVNSEAWYTLDGRKLQGKPAQKGVYISNGKKVIIK